MSDAIVLVGLSGSGKSTVAAAVAKHLGRPLVDLDQDIADRLGAPPAEVIEARGEDAFRADEAAAVALAADVDGAVIATGGGAVIDPLNRWALWNAGTVAWLDAPDEVLLARLAADHETRPLLAGDAAGRLARQRARRERYYRAADVRIDASAPTEAVVASVIEAAGEGTPAARRLFDAQVRRDHLMGPRTARVVLGMGLDAATYDDVLAPTSAGVPVVVADRRAAAKLPELMAALPSERRIDIPSGERQKRLRTVDRLLEAASAMGAERGDAWVGVGGGVTTDMVGAAAALYVRGVNFVAVATTWLGMTDAAIGGKVAVDLSGAKNAAGAFWPPAAIVGDVATQRTLPRSKRLDGMAESLKSGLIGDPTLWDLVETRGQAALRQDEAARYAIIDRSVQLKLDVVDRDPFERGERRTLNLGHTLGHALEIESGYRLPHGKAVVLGLRAVAHIAAGRGAEAGLAERVDDVVASLGYELRREFDAATVKRALTTDKKRVRGRQRWILPMAVGTVIDVDDVTESELEAAIAHISTGDSR
ncbi:MAG: bifunctional shikimate kinase/3-dehydroquinate synthase [Candidatus Limnocylindrales bacterium]